jgi:hypothetical protein
MDSPPWAVCVVGYRTRVPVRGAIVSCFGACWRCWPRIAENDSNPANSGQLDSTVTVRGATVSTFGTMRALGRAMAKFDTLPDKFWSPPEYRTGMFARPALSLRTEAGPPVVMLGFGAFAVRAAPPCSWRSTFARPRRPHFVYLHLSDVCVRARDSNVVDGVDGADGGSFEADYSRPAGGRARTVRTVVVWRCVLAFWWHDGAKRGTMWPLGVA